MCNYTLVRMPAFIINESVNESYLTSVACAACVFNECMYKMFTKCATNLEDGSLAQQPLRQCGARELAGSLQLFVPVPSLTGNVLFVTQLRWKRCAIKLLMYNFFATQLRNMTRNMFWIKLSQSSCDNKSSFKHRLSTNYYITKYSDKLLPYAKGF